MTAENLMMLCHVQKLNPPPLPVFCFMYCRQSLSHQKQWEEEFQFVSHRCIFALIYYITFQSWLHLTDKVFYMTYSSLEAVDCWNNMDLQGIRFGSLTKILHHCIPMIPMAKPILTYYSNHLKKIWRSGHIGMSLSSLLSIQFSSKINDDSTKFWLFSLWGKTY